MYNKRSEAARCPHAVSRAALFVTLCGKVSMRLAVRKSVGTDLADVRGAFSLLLQHAHIS